MSYAAKVIKDSYYDFGKDFRVTTFEVVFPRFLLAELNTHRMFSRNSSSSRAIPTEKIIERVENNPFVPSTFNKRVKGMGVGDPLGPVNMESSRIAWLKARDAAVEQASILMELDVDKSRVNRLLEPFMWHTAIITATEWSNFFALRTHKDAQPEFRVVAELMRDLYRANEPNYLGEGDWHLALVDDDELLSQDVVIWDEWKKISTGRCARASYLTHNGVRDTMYDVELHDRLKGGGHMSPFEHVCRPFSRAEWEEIRAVQESVSSFLSYSTLPNSQKARLCRSVEFSGNFHGWHQYRKDIEHEHDYSLALAQAA